MKHLKRLSKSKDKIMKRIEDRKNSVNKELKEKRRKHNKIRPECKKVRNNLQNPIIECNAKHKVIEKTYKEMRVICGNKTKKQSF